MRIVDQSIVEQLQAHAQLHKLDEIAKSGITKWLEDPDLGSLPTGVCKESVVSRFASRSLCFEPQVVSYPYVETRFDLLCSGSVVGYYRLITLLNGEFEDDYFVFNQ